MATAKENLSSKQRRQRRLSNREAKARSRCLNHEDELFSLDQPLLSKLESKPESKLEASRPEAKGEEKLYEVELTSTERSSLTRATICSWVNEAKLADRQHYKEVAIVPYLRVADEIYCYLPATQLYLLTRKERCPGVKERCSETLERSELPTWLCALLNQESKIATLWQESEARLCFLILLEKQDSLDKRVFYKLNLLETNQPALTEILKRCREELELLETGWQLI